MTMNISIKWEGPNIKIISSYLLKGGVILTSHIMQRKFNFQMLILVRNGKRTCHSLKLNFKKMDIVLKVYKNVNHVERNNFEFQCEFF